MGDRDAPENSYLLAQPYTRGTRTLGHSMIPLRLATQVLRNHCQAVGGGKHDGVQGQEAAVYFAQVAGEMVDNIMEKFFDVEVRLTREELTFDFAPPGSPTLFYLG